MLRHCALDLVVTRYGDWNMGTRFKISWCLELCSMVMRTWVLGSTRCGWLQIL